LRRQLSKKKLLKQRNIAQPSLMRINTAPQACPWLQTGADNSAHV
jgi:hypothetical protein